MQSLPNDQAVTDFISANFGSDLMQQMPLNFAAYYFPNGTMLFYQSYDYSSGSVKNIPLPQEFLTVRSDLITSFQNTSFQYTGYVNYNGTLVLMAGSPLMSTDLSGPSYGFALYGKFQDTTVV